MSKFTFKKQQLAVVLLPILLAACASKAPTIGDSAIAESAQINAIGSDWKKGSKMVKKGAKLVKKGKKQLAAGRENVEDGEEMMEEGQALIDSAEKAYKIRQQKLAM